MSIFAKTSSFTRVLCVMLAAVLMLGLLGSFGIGPVQSNSLVAHADIFSDIVPNVEASKTPQVNFNYKQTDKDGKEWSMNSLVTKAKNIASIILALCAVVCLIFMIINITKLPQSADNEQMRRKALSGILWSGIGVALLGGSSVVVGFFWGLLTSM